MFKEPSENFIKFLGRNAEGKNCCWSGKNQCPTLLSSFSPLDPLLLCLYRPKDAPLTSRGWGGAISKAEPSHVTETTITLPPHGD